MSRISSQVIDVHVLGPPEAFRSGRKIPVPGAKPRTLLTMLGLHAGSVITADVLRAVLWGEDPPPTARKALQTHISTLRRVLGADAVVTHGNGWLLGVRTADSTEFDAAARAARAAVADGDRATAVECFTRARGLWRGAPELSATPRGQAELTRWEEAYASVVDDRIDTLLASGHAAELVGELESEVAETPLRERRWVQLCLALFHSGRQGDALHAYQRARTVLAEELGVEPGPELRATESAILNHQVAPVMPPPAAAPAVQERTGAPVHETLPEHRTTFVGRRDELGHIRGLLTEHQVVTVVGPGGVGKTRLAVAAATSAAARSAIDVWFVDLAPTSADYVAQTVAAATGVAERPDVPLEEAIAARFQEGASLLVLDNCEHVVDAVAGFVDGLVARCPPLVVLATSRERLGLASEQVFTVPSLSLVGPGTGSPKGSEAATLFLDRARAVDPEFDAAPGLVGVVCARCDGIPLAIELAAARCASLGIDGLIAGLDDHLRLLVGTRAGTGRHRSLRAVLDWSHNLLDEDEKAVFRRVGVFANGFDLASVTAVVADDTRPGLSRAHVVDLVGRLTDKNILERMNTPVGSRWRLLDVVRSYALEQLANSGDQADTKARHLSWASTMAAELERQLDAGDAWRETFDLVAADLRAALSAPADEPDQLTRSGHRLTLALALARLHARNGAFTVAQGAYEDAMSIARATADAGQLARAALGASQAGMLFGVAQSRRVALLEEALAAQPDGPSPIRVRLMSRLATELYWSPEQVRGRGLADEAAALAEHIGDDSARAHAAYALHYVTRGPGVWRQQLTHAEEVTRLARRSGETQLELAGLAAHTVGLLQAGDLAGMDVELDALSEAADRLGHPEFQWYATVYRYVRALLDGRFEDADSRAASAVTSAEYAPELAVGLRFAEQITDLREPYQVGSRYRAALLADKVERFPQVHLWRCLALLTDLTALDPGELHLSRARERARQLLGELLAQDPRDDHWLVGCCLLAETITKLARSGHAGSDIADGLARPLADALLPFAGNLAVAGRVAACRGSVSHPLGLLELVLADAEGAVHHLEEATDLHGRLGARPYQARSLSALAHALDVRRARGDRERAASSRRRASELADQIGLPSLIGE